MSVSHVYLVPGFFGFTTLGALNYFRGVRQALGQALASRGCHAEIIECATQPTGSIRRRAQRLLSTVIDSGGLDADSIHFVGHSTGGLDVRLLVTPGVQIRLDVSQEELIAGRTRSVITVATPHFGTPVANFFTTLPGRQVLEALTIMATTTSARYAMFGAVQAMQFLATLDDWMGRNSTILDWASKRLFDGISVDDNYPLWTFLRDISTDQGAIIQLTPEAMHLYNAAVTPRPTVRYSSLVTAVPAPLRHIKPAELFSPMRAAKRGTFALLHAIASHEHRHYPYTSPLLTRLDELCRDMAIDSRTSDGIVPTQSQVYGEILDVVIADHLDVVGQYQTQDPHTDWLPSGAYFDDERFMRAWSRVADEIVAAERMPASVPPGVS